MRLHIGLACASFTLLSTASATVIPGGNLATQTWSPAGSPYIVQGDITVPAGNILTVQAGTVVQFASTDGQLSGLDVNRVELIVKGTLTVNGTAANPVTFSAQSGSGASVWYGIVVDATAAAATIAHAAIANALFGVRSSSASALNLSASTITASTTGVELLAGAPTIAGLAISGCGIGIEVSAGTPTLDAIAIDGNTTGVQVLASASATISNAIITNSSNTAVAYDTNQSGISSTVLLTQSTLDHNGIGVLVLAGSASTTAALTIANSIITNSTQQGVWRDTGGLGTASVSVGYSDVFGNSPNYQDAAAGSGTISADPLYVSATDLHLQAASPCIDAGSPTNASDHDFDGRPRPLDGNSLNGIAYDMGAYEHPDIVFSDGFDVP